MKKLLLDTSSEYLSFLLADDSKLLSFSKNYADRFMSERILVEYDNLLKTSKISSDMLDELIVIVGPGSFTGVRIGVSFILGLEAGLGVKGFGLSSLDALALSMPYGNFTVVARVKDNIFAKREYDFDNRLFSDISLVDDIDFDDKSIFTVNSFKDDRLSLDRFYMNIDSYREFLTNSEPLYLRKPEAELSFDKKSNVS